MVSKKLIAVNAASFIGPFGGNAIFTLIDSIANDLNIDPTLITLSITFLMIPFAIIQFFSGTLSDLFNRHQICVIGLSIYSLGALLVSLSQTFLFLIFSRIIQGIGYGILFPVLLALLGDLTEPEHRGKMIGYFSAIATTGIALGPLIAGFLAPISWQLVFYITAGGALLIGIAFWVIFRNFPPPSKEKRKLKDFFSQIRNTFTWNILIFCIIGFLIFLSYIGIYISLKDIFPSHLSGILLATAGIAGIISAPLAGISVNKFGRKKIAFIGAIILFISILFFNFASSFVYFFIVFCCLGTGTTITWVAINTLVIELDPNAKGTVSSLLNGFRFTGYALASPLYILFGLQNVYIASTVLAGFTIGFLFFLRISIKRNCYLG